MQSYLDLDLELPIMVEQVSRLVLDDCYLREDNYIVCENRGFSHGDAIHRRAGGA